MSSVESSPDLSQSQEATLDVGKISQEIKSLAEDVDGNPETQKQLNDALTDAAIDTLKKLDPSTINDLKNSVLLILENHGNQSGFEQSNQGFVKLAEAFGLQKNADGTWGEKDNTTGSASPEDVDSTEDTAKVELPGSPLKGELKGITPVEKKEGDSEDKKGEQNFYKGKNETVGIYEVATEGEKSELDKTIGDLKGQIVKLDAIDESKLSEEDRNKIEQLKNVLGNMNDAINNTTPENVVILQSFISENLSGTDEGIKFDAVSKKKNGQFDGKFGRGTLTGLNKVLEKTGEYIDKVSEAFNQKKIDAIVEKKDVSIEVGGEIDPKSLVEGLPQEGVSVVLSEGQTIDTSKAGPININLDVKLGDKTKKTLSVTVNVINGSTTEQDSNDSVEQSRKQPETQPLSVDGKQYLPMENKPSSYPEGAVFYSAKAYSPEITSEEGSDSQSTEVQSKFTNVTETADGDGDSIYLMRMGENVYKVKVDEKGNICPTAINMISNVAVVMNNSGSGKAYIENKMPPVLQGRGIVIGWNGEDYTISLPSGGKDLTIEPMTIDGKWIGSLTDSLAFLNFTNYLRNSGDMHDIEFKNDNPDLRLQGNDLYVRVKRTKDVNGKTVRWLKVNKDNFGLPNDKDTLKKFIKYNNHEDWNDDWDKKRPNKYYKPITL